MTLRDIIPAQYRKVVYAVYTTLVFIVGGVQVGYSTAGEGQPQWLLVALAVLGYTGAALGVVATANTNTNPAGPVPVVVEDVDGRHEADPTL